MNKDEILRALFKEYNLFYDKDNPESKANDVYKHKHYTIITRGGIQKIERGAKIKCSLNAVDAACGKDFFTIQALGTRSFDDGRPNETYETFASASELTSTNKYYAEMAEKRARSRIVLTLAGLYEYGVFGEDEADELTNAVKTQQAQTTPRAVYKGGTAVISGNVPTGTLLTE